MASKNKKSAKYFQTSPTKDSPNKEKNFKISFKWIILFFVLSLGFGAGWLSSRYFSDKNIGASDRLQSMRLSGYKFISPLLYCDTENDSKQAEMPGLNKKLTDYINNSISNGKLVNASVYYRDINTGEELNVNQDQKYAPASLNKIPLMIVYYRQAGKDPSILNQKYTVPSDYSTDPEQFIEPAQIAMPNQTYTVSELIEKMIVYSDNNSFEVLLAHSDVNLLKQVYHDLNIEYPAEGATDPNFITARDYSYFLRILYNATYLSKSLSEKALEQLSRVDFKDGLVAGVSSEASVAHKFGHRVSDNYQELHDCGIVYDKDHPYLVCVMTKSTADISTMESNIKDISKIVFDDVEQQSK